jgi:hypothetical protein
MSLKRNVAPDFWRRWRNCKPKFFWFPSLFANAFQDKRDNNQLRKCNLMSSKKLIVSTITILLTVIYLQQISSYTSEELIYKIVINHIECYWSYAYSLNQAVRGTCVFLCQDSALVVAIHLWESKASSHYQTTCASGRDLVWLHQWW